MPRDVDVGLLDHVIFDDVTTLSFLWEITREDSEIFRFTDADKNITYDGNVYYSLNSGTLSSIDQSADLKTDNFDFSIILNDNDISKQDVVAGLFDYASVKVYIVNRESPTDGVAKMSYGKLGQVQMLDDNEAVIEFRGLVQLLQQGIGRTYTHECDADLGDTRCGVDLEASDPQYTHTGSVTSVSNNAVFFDSSQGQADDYFNYGLLTWTSGSNNGLVMEVKDFVSATGKFELVSPMPFTIQAGDTYSAYRGCDKVKSTCRDVFDNIVNFRGFAEIPGPDLLYKVPDVNPDAGLHE